MAYVKEVTKLTCIGLCVCIYSLTQFAYFFLSLLLQCKFANLTLLPLLRFSYFVTPYDAQRGAVVEWLEQLGFSAESRRIEFEARPRHAATGKLSLSTQR